MKFFDKYYIGFQKDRYKNTDNQRMLGFATYIDETSAFTKRKKTVDGWRDKTIETKIISNVPITGFKIIDSVSRHSTSNKLFRIYDPRGFELEITAENLFKIIESHTIVKGDIIEPMVWGREGNQNYLISGNSDEYKKSQIPKADKKINIGDYFKHPSGMIIYRYEGSYYAHTIEFSGYYGDRFGRKFYSYYNRYDIKRENYTVEFQVNRLKLTKVHVYSEWSVDEEGNLNRDFKKHLHARRSYLSDLISIDASEVTQEITSDIFSMNVGEDVSIYCNMANLGHFWFFFKTKEDVKNKNYSLGDFKKICHFDEKGILEKIAEHNIKTINYIIKEI